MPQILRQTNANMTPQRVGNPQAVVVGRTVQVGGLPTMPAVNRHGSVLANQVIVTTPGVGGIRLPQQGLAVRGVAQITHPTVTSATVGQNLVIKQPGAQITVPLHALQNLRPGQGIPAGQGGHLLFKTDSGQYQIMRVGQTLTSGPNGTVAVSQLPTVPISPNSMAIRAVAVTQSISTSSVAMVAPQRAIVTTVNAASAAQTRPSIATSIGTGSAGSSGSGGGGGGGNMSSNMTPDTAKLKCKNFLATLLRLAGEQPVAIANNVRNLIQGLIDGTVEPEVFTNKLQKELNSSPQPCLVPFLKKSLPYLQNSLINGELSIEGVNAPSLSSTSVRLAQRSQVQLQQSGQAVKVQVIGAQGVQLPQRPVMLNAVRTSNSQSIRPMLATSSGIQQLRTPGLANAGIRPATGMPKATIGYATVNRGGLQQQQAIQTISIAGSVKTNMPTFAGAPKVPSLAAFISSANAMAAANQPKIERKASGGTSFSAAGDEDINDVATMGGVNLAEESQRMQGATDLMIGTQVRSCRDETFLNSGLLHKKIAKICQERELGEPSDDVVALVSHATQERLKTLIEKLNVIAEHRLDIVKSDGIYEVTQDVRSQIKFLGELDKIERKRHDEAEREMLLKAAKSRNKTEDPEKEKLKTKAKELQRIEEEQQRHEKANNTALMAIGLPKKKIKLDESATGGSSNFFDKVSNVSSRPRIKRVQIRDMLFLMEQEKDLKRSPLIWKAYAS